MLHRYVLHQTNENLSEQRNNGRLINGQTLAALLEKSTEKITLSSKFFIPSSWYPNRRCYSTLSVGSELAGSHTKWNYSMQSTSTPVHSASTIGSGLDGPHTKRHYETSTTTPVHTSSAAGSQLDGLQNYSIAYTSTTVQSTLSLNYVLAGSYTKQNNFRASVSTQVHSTSLVGFQLDGLLHTKRDSVIMSTSAPIHSSSSVASRYKVLNMKQNYSMASSTVGSQHDRSHAKQKSSLILTPINSTSAVGSDVDGLHSNKIIL